jgi:anti-sigma B factor antagonist
MLDHTPPFRSSSPTGGLEMAPPIPDGTLAGDHFSLALPATLTIGNRQAFKAKVIAALDAGARTVVIEMGDCWYVDSCGCGALVHVSRLARDGGATLSLHALTDDVKTIFELTKLDTLFEVTR